MNNVVAVEGRGAFATNDYAVTALADDGSFAFSHLLSKRTLTLDFTKASGKRVVASWFNPRTGEFTDKKRHAFEPSADGDRVFVLDDAARWLRSASQRGHGEGRHRERHGQVRRSISRIGR